MTPGPGLNEHAKVGGEIGRAACRILLQSRFRKFLPQICNKKGEILVNKRETRKTAILADGGYYRKRAKEGFEK